MVKFKSTPKKKKSTGVASAAASKVKKKSPNTPKSASKTNKSNPRTPTRKSTSTTKQGPSTPKKASYRDSSSPLSASTASTSKVSTPSSKSGSSPKRSLNEDDTDGKNVRKKISKINLKGKTDKSKSAIPEAMFIDWWSPKSLKNVLAREGKVPVKEIKEMTHEELIKTICENAQFKPMNIKTVFPLLCRDAGIPAKESNRTLKSMQRTPDAVKRLIEVSVKLWNKNQNLDEIEIDDSDDSDGDDAIPTKISISK